MIEWALGLLAVSAGFTAASAAGAGPWLLWQVSRKQVVLATVLAAAGLAAVTSTASATGTPGVDLAYRAAVGGLVIYLGSRLRLPILVGATVATAALSAGQGGAALGALAGVGALVGWQAAGHSSGSGRAAGPAAVTSACCALSLLQPGPTLPLGVSALGSATVLVAICALGYVRATAPVRRRLRLAVLGVGTALGLAGGMAGVAL
ncbi:MAG: hypothetical protein WKF86_05695, partial [Acidimicrobiales bacterium]